MTSRQIELHRPAPPATGDDPLVPARRVHELVDCPRLAYLMGGQAEWAETGDTVDGRRAHTRVDRANTPLPEPEALEDDDSKVVSMRRLLLLQARLSCRHWLDELPDYPHDLPRQEVGMSDERTYIVTYDISDGTRWRRVFKTLHGVGEWLQLSVFHCRLSRRRRAELETKRRERIKAGEDHVLVIDIGSADETDIAVMSIGKAFSAIEREAVVIRWRSRDKGLGAEWLSSNSSAAALADPVRAARQCKRVGNRSKWRNLPRSGCFGAFTRPRRGSFGCL